MSETSTPSNEQAEALQALEEALRVLAQGATALADMLGGQYEQIRVVRPEHPAAPMHFATMIEADLGARYAKVSEAVEVLRRELAPGPLQLIEPDRERLRSREKE